MRIAHISDTHGDTLILPEVAFDLVVHSGDFCPNMTRGERDSEQITQKNWLISRAKWIASRLGKAKLLLCSGNHDFIDMHSACVILRDAGVNAECVEDQMVRFGGKTFFGFPWIPSLTGEWNREISEQEISDRLRAIPKVDVLVSHCPPYGHSIMAFVCRQQAAQSGAVRTHS